jgi:hypothetical protein
MNHMIVQCEESSSNHNYLRFLCPNGNSTKKSDISTVAKAVARKIYFDANHTEPERLMDSIEQRYGTTT